MPLSSTTIDHTYNQPIAGSLRRPCSDKMIVQPHEVLIDDFLKLETSWILVSLNGYYNVLLHRNGQLKSLSIEVLYLLICLFIIQWFYFWRDNKWERYIKEFDLWPPQKNQIGGYIVTCVVIILFVNLCVALYLDSSFNPAK